MSYEVLARRLRPRTFDDVVGQRHVTVTLRNAIETGRLPHALLLCGPRGVGKTSIARILARALNCDRGPTVTPCGACSPCLEIAGSTSLDVQEIDAASNTGVDNVREIRESIRYSAAPGKHRIFIVDEVHMLSGAAFNALLKTLEEPPKNSLFIFATTDPQKIPATVLSRVQRFDLKRLPPTEQLERLRAIAASEGIDVPESVLRALVRECDGSMRDSLTLFDRLLAGLGKTIREEDAFAVLDLIDRRVLRDVLDPVLARDPAAALVALQTALGRGIDPARLAADLLGELRNLLVARIAKTPADLIDVAPEELVSLVERARAHDAETFQRLFRVLLTRTQDMAMAPRPAQALEVAVIRLATLPETEALATLVARLEGLEHGPSGGSGPAPSGGSGPSPDAARARPRPPAGSGQRTSAPASEARSEAQPSEGGSRGPSRAGAHSVEARSEPQASEGGDVGRPASVPAREGGPSRAGAPDVERPPARPIPPPLEPAEIARRRQGAKTHPAVLQVMEVLDADLRNIHTEERT